MLGKNKAKHHYNVVQSLWFVCGENGLVHRYRWWKFDNKINAVYRVLNGESYYEVAYSLGMSNKATILSWHRKYLEFGQNSLKLDKRGRPKKMGNKPTKPTKSKFQTNELTDLKKRLKYLEAENAYLKKLAVLVQQRKAREQKKK